MVLVSFCILRPMRRALASLAGLLVLGCAGPSAGGGLWALDEARLEEELVYRVPAAQRVAQARQTELRAIDELLARDERRLADMAATCPGDHQELGVSPGDAPRDSARSKADPARTDVAA